MSQNLLELFTNSSSISVRETAEFKNCSANDGNLSLTSGITVINRNNTISSANSDPIDWGDVVRRFDSSVLHPIELNVCFVLFLFAICAFGFPLNFEIVYRIVYENNLHSKSHYIIKLFMTFSSLFTLFTNVVQICHFIFRRSEQFSEQLCNFFISIVGLSYITFLFNLFMSLIDCCVLINFPLWHERKATPRRAVYSLIVLNVSLVMAMKWMFISRVLPVVCAVQTLHQFTLKVTVVTLLLSCVIVLCVNFILIWRLLPEASMAIAIQVSRILINQADAAQQQQTEEIKMGQLNHYLAISSVSTIQQDSPTDTTGSPLTVDSSSDDTLRQMELKAIKTFLFGIIPLFLMPLTAIISIFSYKNLCLYFWHYPAEECNDIAWLFPYFPVVFSVHALVSPVVSLRINQDFASPCPLRRFRIYCLITICSFVVNFFFIVFFSFLLFKIQ